MFLYQLFHDPGVFPGELFFNEISKEDILLLAVVRQVGVSPNEVHSGIHK